MVGTLLGIRNGRSGINSRRPTYCSLLFRTFHWFLCCCRGFQGSIRNDDPRRRKGFPAATAVDEGTRGNRNVLHPDLCPAVGRGRPRGKFRSGSDPAAACHPCRGTIDFPVLGAAVSVRLDEDGICQDARLAFGALSSAPVLASKVSEKLLGKKSDSDLIQAAAYEASKLAKPMDNTDMNLGYRKKMVSVFTSRALSEAIAS